MEQAQEDEVKTPTIITVTATEFQNNFSKYRKKVKEGTKIMVTANGKEEMIVVKPRPYKLSDLTDMFHGQLMDVDDKDVWEMRRKAYYGEEKV